MSAYVIVQANFKPGPDLDSYRQLAVAAIRAHGGRFLVRGKEKILVEGQGNEFARVMIIEFDSGEAARAWYNSPEYGKALRLSDGAMSRELFIVEGDAP
jgi:uncharacterized protein (DUF1330 family)